MIFHVTDSQPESEDGMQRKNNGLQDTGTADRTSPVFIKIYQIFQQITLDLLPKQYSAGYGRKEKSMNIKIEEANRDRMKTEIKKAEGNARTRIVTVEDIMSECMKIERHFEGIPKSSKKGVTVHISPYSDHFPNAYGHIPYDTAFTLKCRVDGSWALIDISREPCDRGPIHQYDFDLNDACRDAIIKRFESM